MFILAGSAGAICSLELLQACWIIEVASRIDYLTLLEDYCFEGIWQVVIHFQPRLHHCLLIILYFERLDFGRRYHYLEWASQGALVPFLDLGVDLSISGAGTVK